jgi:hypothetical protein
MSKDELIRHVLRLNLAMQNQGSSSSSTSPTSSQASRSRRCQSTKLTRLSEIARAAGASVGIKMTQKLRYNSEQLA